MTSKPRGLGQVGDLAPAVGSTLLQVAVSEDGDLSHLHDTSSQLSLTLTPMSQASSINRFLNQEADKLTSRVEEIYFDARLCVHIEDSFPLLRHVLIPTSFTHLHALYLRNLTFTPTHFDLLYDLFSPAKHRAQIHTLQVYRCLWTNDNFVRFLNSSKGNIAIRQLDMTFNAIGDRGFEVLASVLAYHETCINKLSVGNNQLGDDSLHSLVELYFKPFNFNKPAHEQLRILHLQNHRKITSLHLDDFFQHLAYTNHLQELNLAACAIDNCDWSHYLPFLRSLQRLNLSHNYINDRNLIKLAIGLERCHSLIELNLSYNRFHSYHCHYLRNILEKNQSLQVLVINGNHFQDPSVYGSISAGLRKNKTLLTLALEECGMTMDNVRELTAALQVNTHVELIIRSNPLPPNVIENPRKFFLKELGLQYLSRTREVDSLNHATAWRKRQLEKVQLALESLAIVRNGDEEHSALVASVEEKTAMQGGTVDDTTVTNKSTYSQQESVVSEQALSSKEDFHRNIWKSAIIQRCEYFHSVLQLEKMVDDIEMIHTSEGKFIDIAFGRESFPIGKLEIYSHTTYEQLRVLIMPFLEDYLRTVDESNLEQYRNFKVIDPKGKGVDSEEDLKRRVWPEVFEQVEPIIVIRPSTWLSLS